MTKRLSSTTSWAVAFGAAMLLADGPAALAAGDEHRGHEAHEHGHGTLDVVAEGEELVLELRVPAVNVVGFEHEPSTDAQRRAVEEALAVFRRGGDLFVPTEAAKCRLEGARVALAGIEQHEEGHEGHDEEGRDAHGEDEHEVRSHSELHAQYRFHCDAPGKLSRLEAKLFGHLTDAEEIEARVVTETLQTATELTPGSSVLELAR